MIEKVDITAGSGTPIGADLVSGSYFQYLKLLDGTSGSASPIAGDSIYGLDVDVTRMPAVKIDSGSSLIGVVNISGSETFATDTKQDDIITAIGALNTAVGLLAKLTDTQPVSMETSPEIPIGVISTISLANSFSSSEASYGEYFTGEFEDVSQYAEVSISLFEDTGGDYTDLYIDWSSDGVNVDVTTHIVTGAGGGDYTYPVVAQYMRLRCVSN